MTDQFGFVVVLTTKQSVQLLGMMDQIGVIAASKMCYCANHPGAFD